MRVIFLVALFAVSAWSTILRGATLVVQTPWTAGVSRSSQLWQDPSGNGNDLDGDAVCWQDFTLAHAAEIGHLEWWGAGAAELGFKIEFWRQDPGTIAYQPLGVFYYGGNGSIRPEPPGFITVAPGDYTTTPGPGLFTHYSLDLATPVSLAANSATNPRWFAGIVGLTHQAYATWNWAQGLGGSNRTFQYIRIEGPRFRSLGDGRALVLAEPPPPTTPGDANRDGFVDAIDYQVWLDNYDLCGVAWENGDFTADTCATPADYTIWADNYGPVLPLAGGPSVAVPEPAAWRLALLSLAPTVAGARRRRRAGPAPPGSATSCPARR